jgi:hypothetical protein
MSRFGWAADGGDAASPAPVCDEGVAATPFNCLIPAYLYGTTENRTGSGGAFSAGRF